MRRIKVNKFLILIVFFAIGVLSMGASSWLIINEQSGSPSYISKITPTLTIGGSYNTYEGEELEFTSVSLVAQNGSGNVNFSKSDYTLSYETSALVFTPTTEEICTVQIEVTATPNDTQQYKEAKTTVSVNIYPVAKRGTTYYGTIESALDAGTSVTIDVLNNLYKKPNDPESGRYSPKISSNVTIDANEVLNIKYAEEADYDGNGTANPRNTAHRAGSTANFADSSTDKVAANLKSEVTIKSGVTLTVKGVLNIGGILGKEGQYLAGATSGNYSQITMESNSYISATESTAVIDCLGYIKESDSNNGSRVTMSKGSLYMPFVVYDYGGGQHTVGAAKKGGISPFAIFDMPNVQSIVRCYSNANIVGYADLYTGELTGIPIIGTIPAKHNQTDIKIVGANNSVINLYNDSYVEWKFTPYNAMITATTELNARNTQGSTLLNIYGGASTGTMSLKVTVASISQTVNTNDMLFPVSWKMNIVLNSGTYAIQNKMKFMPGSSLTVASDAIVNISSDFILYPDGFNSHNYYPANKPKANLFINGTLNVTSASSFAGDVANGGMGASMNIATSSLSLKSSEGKGSASATNVTTGGDYQELWPVSETATANIYGVGNSALSTSSYYSNGNEWYTLGDKTITYEENGGSEIEDKPVNIINTDGTGYQLTKDDIPKPAKTYYTFAGWYYDSSFSEENKASEGDNIFGNVTLYAKWIGIEYTLSYVTSRGYTPETETFIYTSTKGASSLVSLDAVGDYSFAGWFLSEDYSGNKVQTYNQALLGDNTEITLYAKWEGGYTVNFRIDNGDPEVFDVVIPTYTYDSPDQFVDDFPDVFTKGDTPEDSTQTSTKYFMGWYTVVNERKVAVTDWSFIVSTQRGYEVVAEWGEVYHLYLKDNHPNAKFELDEHVIMYDSVLLPNVTDYITTPTDYDLDTSELYYYGGGWTVDGLTLKSSISTQDFADNNSLTLEVLWKEKCRITINISYKSESGGDYDSHDASYMYVFETPEGIEYDRNEEVITENKDDIIKYVIGGHTIKYGGTQAASANIIVTTKTVEKEMGTIIITAVKYSKCIAAGTLITLADGTQKAVENITESDILLVFDHESGQYVSAPILFIERDGWAEYNVINLEFSNGTTTKLIYEHALFDLTLNKYVYITESNYGEFVGHEFAVANSENNAFESVTLTRAYVATEYTGCYSLVTAYHLNYFIDGMLSIPGGITGLFNYFEYGEGLKYDEEQMQADIEKYGLYTYEDFKEYVSYEVFEYAFAAKYFKVSVGKGLMTYEDILALIERYVVGHDLNKDEVTT